jgi:RNA polymerase sigma-70 factor (ECF subfamily)
VTLLDLDRESAARRHKVVDTQHVVGDDFARVLAEAQGGDDDQFAVLWRDANPSLLRYLRVLAQEQAEDIAAETWVHVIRNLRRFVGDEAAWRAWLFTTARRRLFDQARSRKRHPAEPLDELTAAEMPSSPDTAQIVMDNLGLDAAVELLSRLPPAQAEVIMLRVVVGMDTEAVAEMLNKTPGNIRVTAHRGLKTLEALLGRAGVTSRAGVTL